MKTGLTGATVLLPSDDAAAYQTHILSYEKLFKPVGPEESALLAIGQRELAATDEDFNRPDLTAVLEMEIRRPNHASGCVISCSPRRQ